MPNTPTDLQSQPLRSVFTSSLLDIFKQLKISLVVSTYQAGKVILVRYDETTGSINTHFRDFDKPMGIAAMGNRLAIGGARTVWEYRNVPAVAARLEPKGKNDACFLPRNVHVTGDIDIHEMAWDNDDQLWLVNTRFSCLCTLDIDHSFHPRWRPPFTSALAPEDRCHLNGLALVDGHPQYVTALGETDSQSGWRVNKASGGILMNVTQDEVILRGLSMPHSPRWYQGNLWLLESGQGSLSKVDLNRRTADTVAKLPGFTRGIDFVGPLAFVGLSQVRESASFSGIPIVKDITERTCGVCVVHIETGQTLGFLRFESGVEEIFAVQVLQDIAFPEMLEWNDPHLANSYVLPDAALADVTLPSTAELEQRPQAFMEKGLQAFQRGEFDLAVSHFRDALLREPGHPDATFSLGVALAEAGDLQEALEQLLEAASREPDRAEIHFNLGNLYSRLRQPTHAIESYQMAITRQPDMAAAHLSLGITLLQTENYIQGFEEYEWRVKTNQAPHLQSPHPHWDGSAVPTKTLLIYLESNDARYAVLLARYIPIIRPLCAKLIMTCSNELSSLLAVVPGVSEIRSPNELQLAEYDVHLSMNSLPHVLKTTPETIPNAFPTFDIDALQKRRDMTPLNLPPSGASLKIGLVWSPHTGASNNVQLTCPLDLLQSLITLPDIAFYNLQHYDLSGLLETLPPEKVQDLSDRIHDYTDLALLVNQMDIVIGVDSAAIHIAGALGKPTWVMQSNVSNWYWPAHSDKTPWYTKARIFQQPEPGNWKGLIQNVRHALSQQLPSSVK